MLEKMKEIIADQLSVDADSITAVSYTHLDVYKRQECSEAGSQ